MPDSFDRPIFEITDLNGQTYKIWANGKVEGFDKMSPCVIINRVPQYVEANWSVRSGRP